MIDLFITIRYYQNVYVTPSMSGYKVYILAIQISFYALSTFELVNA